MEPGTKLGHYQISTLLGKGGMGEVWTATDIGLRGIPKAMSDFFISYDDACTGGT